MMMVSTGLLQVIGHPQLLMPYDAFGEPESPPVDISWKRADQGAGGSVPGLDFNHRRANIDQHTVPWAPPWTPGAKQWFSKNKTFLLHGFEGSW